VEALAKIRGDRITMRRIDISHVMIVRCFPRPKRDTRGTAQSVGTEMVSELGPLVCNEFSSARHVLQRVHVQVLIVGEDQDDVGSLFSSASARLFLWPR
jgi:hypothetical protein